MPIKDTNIYRAIGLMSGTSLDGLDVTLTEYRFDEEKWEFKLMKSSSFEFDSGLLKDIRRVLGQNIIENRKELDRTYSMWVAQCVNKFTSGLDVDIDLIACHGQTIFHDPKNSITIQICDGQLLSDLTNTVVVNDFRSRDMELGGQGAPLVPIGDLLLFEEYMYCLNLGGIANISRKSSEGIDAYDICICNVGANYFAGMMGMDYDKAGEIGAAGNVISELLQQWQSMTYFKEKPPKSLDAGFFEKEMLKNLDLKNYKIPDLLATLYEHIAEQVYKSLNGSKELMMITGGGAHNKRLMELFRKKGLKIHIPETELVDFKEALVFGFLGVLRLRNEVNVLSRVTGSSQDHPAGAIFKPSV